MRLALTSVAILVCSACEVRAPDSVRSLAAVTVPPPPGDGGPPGLSDAAAIIDSFAPPDAPADIPVPPPPPPFDAQQLQDALKDALGPDAACVPQGGTCVAFPPASGPKPPDCCPGLVCAIIGSAPTGTCEVPTPWVPPTDAASPVPDAGPPPPPPPTCGTHQQTCYGSSTTIPAICCAITFTCGTDGSGNPTCDSPCPDPEKPVTCTSAKQTDCCETNCVHNSATGVASCQTSGGCPAGSSTICPAATPLCNIKADGSAWCCAEGSYWHDGVGACIPVGADVCPAGNVYCNPGTTCCGNTACCSGLQYCDPAQGLCLNPQTV